MKDGHRCAVLRPADPELALKLTREWKARVEAEQLPPDEAQAQFSTILGAQEYRFMGFVTKAGRRADVEGNDLGTLEKGDSLVGEDALEQLTRTH